MRVSSGSRVLGVAIGLGLVLAASQALALTGAIYTSLGDGTVVNQNTYDAKSDVYLNGGPQNPNGPGLPDGTYYFQVTTPSGDLLSTDPAVCRQLVVVGGVVAGATGPCPHANGAFNPANGSTPVQLIPFDDTTNQGGEYKVWLIAQTADTSIDADNIGITFSNSDAKTDNFKVLNPEGCEPNCPPPPPNHIAGAKFYDANLNGEWDDDEPGIPNWLIELFGTLSSNTTTDANGTYAFLVPEGTYGVCEVIPEGGATWIPTKPTVISGLDVPPDQENQDFGNVCLGAGGGLTKGFWQNKNGERQINDGGTAAPELALLSSLNLRGADGSDFDPGDYATFKTWIKNANAVNMAYMLSAQLAAMELNVEAGFVSGGSLVYAPGCGDTGPGNDFISIANLMTAANAALGADGYTPAGDPNRDPQECLKDALDNANNNLNFVQGSPCEVTYTNDEESCAPVQDLNAFRNGFKPGLESLWRLPSSQPGNGR